MKRKFWTWLNTPPAGEAGRVRQRTDNWPPWLVNLVVLIWWAVALAGVIWWAVALAGVLWWAWGRWGVQN